MADQDGSSTQPPTDGDNGPDAEMSRDLPSGMFRSGSEPKPIVGVMHRRITGPVNVQMQYTEVGNNALFEGDIVLASAEDARIAAEGVESRSIGIVGAKFRWADGKVAYVIANNALDALVGAAIEHWQEHTPFTFHKRDGEKDYLSFEVRDGCWSHVGRQGGKQVISLGPGCGLGAAIHEIGHALGLWHEQSRSDRDSFIEIIWANIEEKQKHNFDKHVQDGQDLGPYDHHSIMHYPETAFSKNGEVTIRTKDGQPIGQRDGLSAGDIAGMKLMYPNLNWP